jgi:hypothetical protein
MERYSHFRGVSATIEIVFFHCINLKTLAKFKVECEWRQGLQEAQLIADYFAASSQNNPRVHFFQSFSLVLQRIR